MNVCIYLSKYIHVCMYLYLCGWLATHEDLLVGTVELLLKRAGLRYNFYTDFYSVTIEV